MSTIYIIGEKEKLLGAVPLAKIVLAPAGTPLMMLSTGHLTTIHPGADEKDSCRTVRQVQPAHPAGDR